MFKFKTITLTMLFIITGLIVLGITKIDSQNSLNRVSEQMAKNQAIQECFKSATVTTREGDSERTEPIFYIYELCVKDKGYQTEYLRQ